MNENKGEIKKMMIILSKATLENVYAAFVLANGARMEGIDSEIFFTFFGLEAVHKKKNANLHIATVGNPAMHIPTMVGGLPGMEALATTMMKKEMAKSRDMKSAKEREIARLRKKEKATADLAKRLERSNQLQVLVKLISLLFSHQKNSVLS